MNELSHDPAALLATIGGWALLRAVALVLIGLLLAKFASRAALRSMRGKLKGHGRALVDRAVYYGVLGLFVFSALWELGFSLELLMGAAGILTVAIGFASQTTASNFISGLFLLGEQPFVVGDTIRVGETVGEVISIDPLAVKLRTFDNRMIRIPNETLLKSEIINLTKFTIRRIDLLVGVAYKEDLRNVEKVLRQVAARNPRIFDEPEPIFRVLGFGSSSVDLQFSAWTETDGYVKTKTGLYIEVKEAFDREGIEIPFPHLSLYAGSKSKPFPVEQPPPSAPPAQGAAEAEVVENEPGSGGVEPEESR